MRWYRCIVAGRPMVTTAQFAGLDAQPVEWRPIERLQKLAERLPLPPRDGSSSSTPSRTSSQ